MGSWIHLFCNSWEGVTHYDRRNWAHRRDHASQAWRERQPNVLLPSGTDIFQKPLISRSFIRSQPLLLLPSQRLVSYGDGPVEKAGAAADGAPCILQHPPVLNGMGKDGTCPQLAGLSPTVTSQICFLNRLWICNVFRTYSLSP